VRHRPTNPMIQNFPEDLSGNQESRFGKVRNCRRRAWLRIMLQCAFCQSHLCNALLARTVIEQPRCFAVDRSRALARAEMAAVSPGMLVLLIVRKLNVDRVRDCGQGEGASGPRVGLTL